MANVAYYFGFKPLANSAGQEPLITVVTMAAAETTAGYINTPLSGTTAAATVGFAADTTAGLGSVVAYRDKITNEKFQYRPAAAQTNAWKVHVADTRNNFLAAADGTTTAGQTYAIEATTDNGGDSTNTSTSRVDASNTHATANTIEALGLDTTEIKNVAGVGERIVCKFAQRAIYA